MSDTTVTGVEDPGAPVMLDSKDVVEIFKQLNLAVYAEARRRFYREVNLSPFKPHSESVLRLVEWSFWDWFAFDCSIRGVGLTGDMAADMMLELEYDGGDGISPFLALAQFVHERDERIGDREISGMREADATNFTSMFWIKDASAARGNVLVEDLIHGGDYTLHAQSFAAKYDGAHGGLIVNRIARVRGVWRQCAIPLYEARRPDSPEVGQAISQGFRDTGYRPDFPGLVRFFYGRTKDTGLDWEDMALAHELGSLERVTHRACEWPAGEMD